MEGIGQLLKFWAFKLSPAHCLGFHFRSTHFFWGFWLSFECFQLFSQAGSRSGKTELAIKCLSSGLNSSWGCCVCAVCAYYLQQVSRLMSIQSGTCLSSSLSSCCRRELRACVQSRTGFAFKVSSHWNLIWGLYNLSVRQKYCRGRMLSFKFEARIL